MDTLDTSAVHHCLDCDERAAPWQANARCLLCEVPTVVRFLMTTGGSLILESFEVSADGDPRGPRALCVGPQVLALGRRSGSAPGESIGHHRVHRCY
jgi:hypothetical protein